MPRYMNYIANRVMKPLLRSPLHFLVSKNIMLITFTGRKSGKVFTTPVQYRKTGDIVTFLTPNTRNWWKNLQNAAPVKLVIQGEKYDAAADTIITEQEKLLPAIREMYSKMTEQQVEAWSNQFLMIRLKVRQN